MTTTEKAYVLIGKYGKAWLAQQLQMNYRTLVGRLDAGNWKAGETMIINQLNHKL
jgi:hypothetical protein